MTEPKTDGPVLPIIHMNGTGAKTLLEDYRNAMDAVQNAAETIGTIEFNARDYYPVDGLWEKALAERRAMRESLQGIHENLQAIAIHCMEQGRL